MSTASSQPHHHRRNNNGNGNGNGDEFVFKKDQASGPSDPLPAIRPNNIITPLAVSPRIPRKRSSRTQDEIENDFDVDDQKPILSSPSIVVTSPTTTTPRSPSVTNRYPLLNDTNLNNPDQQYHHQDKRRKSSTATANNWIAMDDYGGNKQQHQQQLDDTKYETKQRLLSNNESDDLRHHQHLHQDDNTKIDVSLYTTKKNVAQGMLDIALLSANCSQLKYLLYHYERDASISNHNGGGGGGAGHHQGGGSWTGWLFSNPSTLDLYFITNFICLCLSILLQIFIGILLIMNSRHNNVFYMPKLQKIVKNDSYSNWILMAVFIVTVVNIFLSVFISAR